MQTQNPHFTMHHRHAACAALLLLFTLHSSLFAQQVAQPDLAATGAAATPAIPVTTTKPAAAATTGTTAKTGDDEVHQMDVFTVTGSNDDGYSAERTTSASGLNTPIADVAASISAFTPEFLNDIGAATVEDIINYAGNGEMDLGDSSGVDMNTDYTLEPQSTPQFNIRGMSGSVLVDGVEANGPVDQYNIDNVELASGANSIVFGMGGQGGVLSMSSGGASLQRNTLKFKSELGIYDSPGSNGIPYKRFTLNYNLVLIPKRLGLRINGLLEDSKSWRMWEYRKNKRINPVISFKPWTNTNVKISYEAGMDQSAISRYINPNDGYTRWLAADGQTMAGFGPSFARPRTTTVNYPHIFNENNGIMYNYTQAYEGSNYTAHPLSPSLAPFEFGTVGPGAGRREKIKNGSISIEQRLGNLNLQFRYVYTFDNAFALSPRQARPFIQVDPNTLISPAIWVSADRPFLVENDYAGRLYMENDWTRRTNVKTTHTFQLNTNYNLNLKKWGRHRFMLSYQYNKSNLFKDRKVEVLVDDNNTAIDNPGSPEALVNRVYRRNYITEGDYSTYHEADPTIPVYFATNDKVYHSAWTSQGEGTAAHIKQNGNAFRGTVQSYWFNDHLSTIFGGRYDIVDFQQEWPQYRVLLPDPEADDQTIDPRITSGQVVANGYAFDGKHWLHGTYKPFTFSAGAVYKFTKRARGTSLSANYSTNRNMPILDGRRVLPTGNLPPLTEGSSADIAIRYDFFNNGKLTVKVGWFDNRKLHDASYVPNGSGSTTSDGMGATNLFNIYDALYFLTPTAQSGIPTIARQGFGAGPGKGPGADGNQWGWKYAYNPPVSNVILPYGSPPQYNAGMMDTHSRGYEFELTGRPMKNLDIRFTFSYTDRNRENIMNEVYDYFNKNIPVWMAMANSNNPNDPDGIWYVIVNDQGARMPLANYIWGELYSNQNTGQTSPPALDLTSAAPKNDGSKNGNLRTSMAAGMMNQVGKYGTRPYKANLTIRYSFNSGWFKGLAVMVACRYRSPTLIPDRSQAEPSFSGIPDHSDTVFGFDPNVYYNIPGNSTRSNGNTVFDFMTRYKRKIWGGRSTMTLQMNLKNFGSGSAWSVARWNTDGTPRNYYLPNPRKYTLTATFDF